MSPRLQNAGLVALLVATLVIVGFALRTPAAPVAAGAPNSPAASVSPSASASASPSAKAESIGNGSTVAFLGDSFAAGAGASTPQKRWTTLLSTAKEWKEVNRAHAQTGYVRVGSAGDCTPQICPAFTGEVAKTVAAAPAMVIITGGANDISQDRNALSKAVTDTVKSLKQGLPQAKIVVVDPWWDLREPLPAELGQATEVIKSAATAAGATYLATGQPLNKHPELMDAAGVQPNDAGHQALADVISKALTQSGLLAR